MNVDVDIEVQQQGMDVLDLVASMHLQSHILAGSEIDLVADADVDGVCAFRERLGCDEDEYGEEEDEEEDWVWFDHGDCV